jgi:hypothetical protein
MKVVGPVAEIVKQTRLLIELSRADLNRWRREIESIRESLERSRSHAADGLPKVRAIKYALIVK